MASLSEFVVNDPGTDFGRVDPVMGDAFEGDAVFVLGSDRAGAERLVSPGDRIDVFQSADPGAAEIVRISTRLRGPDTMPALSVDEPFALVDGQTITIRIDEAAPQTITFLTADFTSIGAATALEVARVINRDGTALSAALTGSDAFSITSLTRGRRSRVEVTGGTATALGLTELAWRAALLLDGVESSGVRIYSGELRAPLDMAANLTAYGNPVEIRFRLEVVRV